MKIWTVGSLQKQVWEVQEMKVLFQNENHLILFSGDMQIVSELM